VELYLHSGTGTTLLKNKNEEMTYSDFELPAFFGIRCSPSQLLKTLLHGVNSATCDTEKCSPSIEFNFMDNIQRDFTG
jgi:hypothetical protein